ncbi:LysM peptidoglycan-binding domain-containing protein [Methylophilus sp. Leaf408]|uniref:LysM peptidoglycan-binding domain-containing protein n=1 Tax=Methylophilus sp. Leaf408 TaxID=2876561 RepID=UPI001E2F0DD4|nr:LysM peptidoglycan-binding domain-containing protein [Methylophilus sp. Leaf408]
MVALVTGNGVGLGNSSASVLGQAGQLGIGQLPGAAGNAYVNASNGNLIIQRQDELLIGRGPDIGVYQTYNSKGTLDFDNGDNWQLSLYRQISGLTGSGVNTAGSTITRTSGDGTTSIYTYDDVSRKYISKDGSGSYDTLSYNSASKVWTWQDGDSRITESYSTSDATVSGTSKWRITTVTDLDNNRLTYSYNTTTGLTDLIDTVATENGEVTKLIYNNNKQLVRIDVIQGSVTTSRVSYAYDGNNRLSQVTTDLTPETAGDSKTYVTTYTYVDSTSKQIASISNSDGTKVGFSYDGSGRVTGIKDYTASDSSESHTTIISYGSSSTTITTTNNANVSQVTTLTYDANGQLTNLQGPSQSGQNSSYIYNSNGDVVQVTDNRGHWTKYTYDTKGNQVSSQDNLGNTVTKTYGANNQLLSQTTYTTPDANVSDSVLAASGAQTTYYVYSTNGKNQLRFSISPEGRVTEYRYNSNGQVESTLQYAAGTFDVSALASSSQDFSSNADGFIQSPLPDGYALVSGALQVSSKRQTTTTYPFLSTASQPLGTRFTAEVTTQALSPFLLSIGVTAGQYLTPDYRRQWVTLHGSSLQLDTRIGGNSYASPIGTVKANTTYVVEAVTESNGDSTLYFYEKGQPRETGYASQINLGSSNPSFSMQTFNGPGAASASITTNTIRVDNLQMQMMPQELALVSWVNSQDLSKLQRTDYVYDLLGQISQQKTYTATDASTGVGLTSGQMVTQYTYDSAGNLRQKIDPRGTATGTVNDYLTSYSYDGLNRLTVSKQYDSTGLEARSVSTVTAYNEGNRQITLTLANGLVTTSTYDLAGRLMSVQKSEASTSNLGTISYAYDKLNNLRTVTDELGNITYYLYDSANRKVGEIDENKNLTEWVYNANGQVIRTIQYNKPVTATLSAATALTNMLTTSGIRIKDAANDRIAHKLYDAAGRLAKEIDGLGYVTEYQYDGAGRLLKTIEYANALSTTQLNAINAATTEILPSNSNTLSVSDSSNDRVSRNLYDKDGELVGTLDAEGYLTEYIYDQAGRQLEKIRYAPKIASTNWGVEDLASLRNIVFSADEDTLGDLTTKYIYDASGRLVGVVDAENYLTEYEYDLSGNKVQEIRYGTRVFHWAGNTIAQTRPERRADDYSVSYSYDMNGKLTLKDIQPDGLLTRYAYDSVGNLLITLKGEYGGSSQNQRAVMRNYDSRGNLIAELSGEGVIALLALGSTPQQPQVDSIWNTYGTRYIYDNAGRLINKVEPNGINATGNRTLYYYDKEGKLIYTINPLGEVTGTEYNSFDQVIKTRRYNIRISAATLANLNGGLAAIPAATITALQNGGASDIQLGYDKRGQLISTTDELLNVNSRSYNAFGEIKDRTDKTEGTNTVVTRYEYDRRGLLGKTTEDYSETNGINRITQAVYDAYGRVIQTTDGRNNLTNFIYDRLGRTVTTTDALSNYTTVTYDAFDRKVSQVDARGNITNWSYNATDRSMTMTTPEGISVVTIRNHFGEVVEVRDGGGSVTTYKYNTDGQLTLTTEDSGANKLNLASETIYDKAGRVYQTKDAKGTVTQYSYDAVNRVFSKTIDPTSVNPSGLNLVTSYLYDAQGRQIWTKDAKGVWTKMDYDKKGQLTLVTTDPTTIPNSNAFTVLTGTTANASGLNLKTSYTYDARGKKLTLVEGYDTDSARNTQYKYDKLGRLIENIVDPGNDKLNLTTKYIYDQNDNVVLKTDASGNKTVYTYDANDRLEYTVDALGYVERNFYDGNGNLIKTRAFRNPLTAATLSSLQGTPVGATVNISDNNDDRVTRYGYDKDNRLTYTTDAEWSVTRNEYDANGNVVKRTRYATKAAGISETGGAPNVSNNTADRIEQTVYDAANRATYSIDAEKYVTRLEYDVSGNVIKKTKYATALTTLPAIGVAPAPATSGNDQVTQYGYDRNNRLTDETRAAGSAETVTTHYDYDALGNQVKMTEAYNTTDARITQQTFDKAGRKVEAIDALGNKTKTEYNAAGYIVKVTDALGNAGYFFTDGAGRVTLQVDPEEAVTQTQYDGLGNVTQVLRFAGKIQTFGTGTLSINAKIQVGGTPPTDGVYVAIDITKDQKQTFEYDKLGQKRFVKTWIGATSSTVTADYYTEEYTYTAFGDVEKYTARNGLVTTYTYDKQSRKKAESFGGILVRNSTNTGDITLKNTFNYNWLGDLVNKTEADGALTTRTTAYGYDKLGRLERTNQSVQTTTGVSAPAITQKTYDARGNVIAEKDANGNWTYTYYDKQDRRIASAKADGSYTVWEYGALSNISKETKYANKIQTSGTGTLTATSSIQPVGSALGGNTVFVITDSANDRVTEYQYDKVSRQTETKISGIITGTYNTATQEYSDDTSNITTKTEYDPLGNIIRQTDANGYVTYSWYNKAGQVVAKVDAEGYAIIWDRDVYGNIIKETRYATRPESAATNPLTINNATTLTQLLNTARTLDSTDDRITTIGYDKLNRVSTETVANVLHGQVDGVTGNLSDASGNAAPTGSVTVRRDVTTSYKYDGLNNIIEKTDGASAITNWEFDGLGRERSVINPQFTDFEGNAVRTRTDKEYDGLNNLTRELRRGRDNAVETDEQITTYTYGVGGRLISEKDATNAVTTYEYDLNGNVTKERLLGRVNANGDSVDDVTIYTYDALNRQVKTTDQGTGVIQEVQYNSFSQITGKRTYTGATPASTSWDEYSVYDRAGKVWKSNSGDGVTKVYINDRNGNATATITSTVDVSSMTLSAIRALSSEQVMYTYSVYDKKNQRVTTIQPEFDVSGRTPYTTNPILGGNLSLGYGPASVLFDWERREREGFVVKDYYLKPKLTIPETLGLPGNTRLEMTVVATNWASYTRYATVIVQEGGLSSQLAPFYIGSFDDVNVTLSVTMRLIQSSLQGDILLATPTFNGGLNQTAYFNVPKKLYIANQPYVPGDSAKSTDKILLSYRPAGTNQPYTTVAVPNVTNMSSVRIGGLFAFDLATLVPAGNYEYEYVALNSAGQILNQQSSSLNTSIPATPTRADQAPIEFRDVGRAIFSNTSISNMSSGLQLINQGANATSVVMRYRLKDIGGDWITPTTSFAANTATTGFGAGSFVLNPTGLSGMANGNNYEVQFDIKDSSNAILRTVAGVVSKDSGGYFSIGALTNTATSSTPIIVEIKRSQAYNAFGEIVSETDGRGNVTSYTYNTMGAMTKKTAPKVNITKENGEVDTNATPTTEYIYDAIGRVIAVKDANGNLNTQVWRAGSTADGNITLEKHADSGLKKAGFDIFGNKRTEFDELATGFSNSVADAIHRTDYTYDKENRLTKVEHQARSGSGIRSVDEYTYDVADNRISHKNANGDTEKTFYDSLGRVTKTTSFMKLETNNFETNYSYTYINNIVGVGGATVGGWQKTTIDATGRTLVDKTDTFNRVTWHQDLGGHQFTYVYNQAGWLTSQTSLGSGSQYSGQNIVYSYYNNGNIKAIHDKALGMYTYYEYDKDGNRSFEGYISLNDASNLAAGGKNSYQYAVIEYDAMNRITSMGDPKANILYEYDAVGNRRMVKSIYHDGANGSPQEQTYWYKYDSMNRFLITMGTLSGTRGVAGTTITTGTSGTNTTASNSDGVSIMYNVAGQRVSAFNAKRGSVETYTYTNDGYLENVYIKESNQSNAVLRSSRVNDVLGRVTSYVERNAGNAQTYSKTIDYDKDSRVIKETGKDGATNFTTNYTYYTDSSDTVSTAVTAGVGQLAKIVSVNGSTTVNTTYQYQYWDEAKQLTITENGYNPALGNSNQAWKPGYSDLKYDVNGHLKGAYDYFENRSFRYVSDAQGLILSRDEVAGTTTQINRVQRYYYVDGKRVGDVGNSGDVRTDYVQAMAKRQQAKIDYKNFKPISSADFDQNYEPISPSYPSFAATAYTVKSGDNLQSIARSVWGDADMWYLIADANGLDSGSTLTAGQVLVIPNKVTNIHNNSGTYRVYNPGEAIGDVNPTLPTAPEPPKKKEKCGGFAQLIVAAVTIAVTVMTYGTYGALGSAALGNLAGQVAGNALGVQQGFDFKSFATSVATAGVADGLLGPATNPSGMIGNAIKNVVGTGYTAIAVRAAVGNVIGQGVGNITGTQKGFSWSSVAVSGIGATAAAFATNQVGLTKFDAQGQIQPNETTFGADFGRAAVDAGSFALSQLVIKGGKINWQQVATDTVTNLIQNRAESNAIEENTKAAKKQKASQDSNNVSKGIILSQATGVGISFNADQVENAISTEEIMKSPVQKGGLDVTWTDSPQRSAVKNGGLYASMDGVPNEVREPNLQLINPVQLTGKRYSDSTGTSLNSKLENTFGFPTDSLISVFKISGAGGVHESITEEAAKNAGVRYDSALKKGVRWPDVPSDKPGETSYWNLLSNEVSRKPGSIVDESHNGTKQFWHSMTPNGSGYTNAEVRDLIVNQAVSWYEKALKDNNPFYVGNILHMVQDSYSLSHVTRNEQGAILRFQSYDQQIPDKHGVMDKIPMFGTWRDVPGAEQALNASTDILTLFKNKVSSAELKNYLNMNVYKIAPGVTGLTAGGSELRFQKKQPVPYYGDISINNLR